MAGAQAVYLGGNDEPYLGAARWNGQAAQWRGRRVRLSLRLKHDGETSVQAWIRRRNGGAIFAEPVKAPEGGWRLYSFVLEVPDDASNLLLDVKLDGRGIVWADSLATEAVGDDIPVSKSTRVGLEEARP